MNILTYIHRKTNGIEILKVTMDRTKNNEDSAELEIGGVVVCHSGNTNKKLRAIVERDDQVIEYEAEWYIASPRIAKEYPDITDSDHTRYRITGLPPLSKWYNLSLELVLEDGQSNIILEVKSLEYKLKQFGGIFAFLDYLRNNIEIIKDKGFNTYWREIFDGVLPEMETKEILMSSILLNCAVQENGVQTFLKIQKVKEKYLQEEDQFNEFWQEISNLLATMTIGQHGYKLSLSARDAEWLWNEIETIISTLRKELELDVYIVSGTLLGLIRDGSFIGHDDDIDLAVMLKSNNAQDASREWINAKSKLDQLGIVGEWFKGLHCQLKLKGITVGIDVFPSWIVDDKLFIYPHTAGEIDKNSLYPLKSIEILGANILLPNKPEDILAINYGNNWMIPDPSWSFHWGKALINLSDFIQSYEEIMKNEV